jgi:hypothetical protein
MGVHVISRENVPDDDGNRGNDIVGYAVGAVSEISNLPGVEKAAIGSTALVIETGEVWMLWEDGWRKI